MWQRTSSAAALVLRIMQQIQSPKFLLVTLFATAAFTTVAAQTNVSTNPLEARIEKARAEKQIDRRLQALAGVANELPLPEIPNALKAAADLKSMRERLVFQDSALKRWGQLAPAEAFAHVSQMAEGLSKVEAVRSISAGYACTNGSAAAAAALKMKPGRARSEAVSIIAEQWARSDPQAALKWANQLSQGALREMALHSIYFVWVHSDPVAVSATAQNLPAGDTRNALLMNIAQNWAVIDPRAAIKWAQALPVEAEKDLAVVIATESWADSDPRAAVDFAWKLVPTELRQRATLAALERWAMQDPEEAFEKVAKSADRLLHEQGIARVVTACASVCPDMVSRWVEALPIGPIRDSAIGAYVEAASAWHPEAAARLAVKTADPLARQERVRQCFRLWLACDSESAKQWLKQTDFAEEDKRSLLSQIPSLEFSNASETQN